VSDTNPPENEPAEGDRPELSIAARILLLQQEHRELDARIAELYDYPSCDQLQLQRLKRKKLQLKDTIQRLKDDLIPDLNA
jgi:hypothetical protein